MTMLKKIRKLLCKFGFHKWEKLPKEKYFKMDLKDENQEKVVKELEEMIRNTNKPLRFYKKLISMTK